MRLYLDEHIPVALVTGLAAHGVDCLSTQHAGSAGLSDEEQLVYATEQGRALFTFNCKDFLPLVERWHAEGKAHAGLILSKEFPVAELLRRFRLLLLRQGTDELQGRVLWLTP